VVARWGPGASLGTRSGRHGRSHVYPATSAPPARFRDLSARVTVIWRMEFPSRPTERPRGERAPDLGTERLSARELEIAVLVAAGLKDDAIAGRLALAASTVGTYVRRVRAKLGLSRRSEIAAWVRASRRHDSLPTPALPGS
jgi:DNA-binding CsgD family transcriptional regulator